MPLQCVSAILTAITAEQQPSSGGLDLRATSSITCGASAVALSSQLHRALKTGHCSLARHAFCFLREGHSVLYRLPSIIVATRRENTSALQHLINHDVTWQRTGSAIRQERTKTWGLAAVPARSYQSGWLVDCGLVSQWGNSSSFCSFFLNNLLKSF